MRQQESAGKLRRDEEIQTCDLDEKVQ